MTATPTPLRELAQLLSRASELLARCEIDLKWLAMHAEPEVANETPELLGDIVQFQIDSENAARETLSARDEAGAVDDFEELLRDYVEDYEYLGETEDGRDACYQPNERERLLIEDAIRGWEALEAPRIATPPASGEAGADDLGAEVQAYRLFHLAVDNALIAADVLTIDREGDYDAAIENTLNAIRRLAAALRHRPLPGRRTPNVLP